MEDHDWHLYDITKYIEVKREDGVFKFRKDKNDSKIVTLSDEEFDRLRSGEPLLEELEDAK
jgi:hypothetical protein